jgi:xanthine/CO dehydrogenase XdhC/CoxF family maturation factor
MISIYQALSDLESSHQPAALCTVVKASSSTPGHVGCILLVDNPEREWQLQPGCSRQSRIVKVR